MIGLHLPTMVTAWTDPGSMTEYASSPTPFWMVKLMDLGIAVPSAIAIGAGLLRGCGVGGPPGLPPADRLHPARLVTATAMAVVMLVRGDPDAAPALAAGFGLFACSLTAVAVALCRAASAPSYG